MSREGIEPFGATARFSAACFTDRCADHDSNKVRLVRFELTRPKAHVLNVVRPTKLRHSRIDSASWIRTSSIPGFKPRWSASCLSRRKVTATYKIRSRVPHDARREEGQRWPYGNAPCTSWGQIRTVSTTWFEQARSTSCLPSRKYPRKDSNFHFSRSERDDSYQLVYVGVSALDEI